MLIKYISSDIKLREGNLWVVKEYEVLGWKGGT